MKNFSTKCFLVAALLGAVQTGAAPGQTAARMDPIPLKNWKVPAIETLFKVYGSDPIGNTHFVNPGAFVFQSTTPCRLLDTRGTGQGGIFGVGETRIYSITLGGPACIASTFPPNIAAVSLNITVTQTAGPGFLTGYATGGSLPGVSNVNWTAASQTVSNAAIVPTAGGVNSNITIFASQSTHVILDINGIFLGNISSNADQLAITTALATSGAILGVNSSVALGAAGVAGRAGTAAWNDTTLLSGVTGFSDGATPATGVLGEGTTRGVTGARVNASGAIQSSGIVGAPGSDGLYTANNLTAVGTKSFVEPLETEASKIVKYVSLEGPEAGTYFRGRGRFVGGRAVIEVPEDFRQVTDPEGLTVQITPMGKPTAVAVVRAGLDWIEAEAAHDVPFSYLVQGVRKAFKDWQPIQSDDAGYFEPQSADARMPAYFSEETKRRLIANGTYNPDGTVNMRTAERSGWAAKWRERNGETRARSAGN